MSSQDQEIVRLKALCEAAERVVRRASWGHVTPAEDKPRLRQLADELHLAADHGSTKRSAEVKVYETVAALKEACRPLVDIAEAYDNNSLDDEARRFWGKNLENENDKDPAHIELYCGRGGKRLLTLADCFVARKAYKRA